MGDAERVRAAAEALCVSYERAKASGKAFYEDWAQAALEASGYPAEVARLRAENERLARERDSLAGLRSLVGKRDASKKRLAESKKVIETQGKAYAKMRADLDRALDALGLTLDALSYMTAPTMARPSDRDPADFAMTDATEKDVRLALRTCIEMALACLNNVEATGVSVEEVRIRRAVLTDHDREPK